MHARRGVSRLLDTRSPALLFHLAARCACHVAPFDEETSMKTPIDPQPSILWSPSIVWVFLGQERTQDSDRNFATE